MLISVPLEKYEDIRLVGLHDTFGQKINGPNVNLRSEGILHVLEVLSYPRLSLYSILHDICISGSRIAKLALFYIMTNTKLLSFDEST